MRPPNRQTWTRNSRKLYISIIHWSNDSTQQVDYTNMKTLCLTQYTIWINYTLSTSDWLSLELKIRFSVYLAHQLFSCNYSQKLRSKNSLAFNFIRLCHIYENEVKSQWKIHIFRCVLPFFWCCFWHAWLVFNVLKTSVVTQYLQCAGQTLIKVCRLKISTGDKNENWLRLWKYLVIIEVIWST